jgi:pimeloyl-ACP methyl ester carboxylesterase
LSAVTFDGALILSLGESMLTSNDTHESARTQFVQIGDVRFAYRRFGRHGGLPLLFLNYFAANMDDWDPTVTNGFAAEHEVILLDNAGVGGSTGETPPAVAAMTKTCVDFCSALDLKKLDVVGFSLGGMIAQQLAFEYPDMIRRMILLAAGPRGVFQQTGRALSRQSEQFGRKISAYRQGIVEPAQAQHGCGRPQAKRGQPAMLHFPP